MTTPSDRYSRQSRFPPLGDAGQQRLAAARAVICGCGALGSMSAALLARAGVGNLRIVDRDFVELNNLQRQMLFDESDVAADLPKAVAAAENLRAINSSIEIEPVVADITAANVLELCAGADVLLDGTDNFETRFLLNEAALKLNIPWVYGGAIGASGQCLTMIPGETICLRCLIPESPPPGSLPTCDSAGILGPIIGVIASLQVCEAIKIASGNRAAINRQLTVVELWENQIRQVGLQRLQAEGCPTCRNGEFPWLAGEHGSQTAILCGRNAVQIRPAAGKLDLADLATKLAGVGAVTRNAYLLRLAVDDYVLTVFPDGRAIIAGVDDPVMARTLYARYIGA
jgi:molybdopterin/thiamine biosynthesis adenylyltransferase